MQMTTALSYAVSIWSILGALFIAARDYRTKSRKLN